MFFEGPEKKLEIFVKDSIDLLSKDDLYWQGLVERAGAKILSCVLNENIKAYLLSESSLFVFKDRVLLITCGQTRLVKSAEYLLNDLGQQNISFVSYQRKNELFPVEQKSTFLQDAAVLKKLVQGEILRFGAEGEHHISLFHYSDDFLAPQNDSTIEILMHGIPEVLFDTFVPENKEAINFFRKSSVWQKYFADYLVDDFLFSPRGYSLNGILEQNYFSVHITPQKVGSYVSFESNAFDQISQNEILKAILELFQPDSCDFFAYHPNSRPSDLEIPKSYLLRKRVAKDLQSGYRVSFDHLFSKPDGQYKKAKVIEL